MTFLFLTTQPTSNHELLPSWDEDDSLSASAGSAGGFYSAGLSAELRAAGRRVERHPDAATGRDVVVAGSYHRVPASPVSPLQALVDIPKGLIDAAAVIFLVFLAGGAFTVVDLTGALRRGVDWLLEKFRGREAVVIPIISVLFATMGALENMQEEIVPLVPVLLILMRRIGYPTLTAAAVSIGSAAVGAAFSPLNPFQVGIAQKLAQLPLLSGGGFRLVFPAAGPAHLDWRHRPPRPTPPRSSRIRPFLPIREPWLRAATTASCWRCCSGALPSSPTAC